MQQLQTDRTDYTPREKIEETVKLKQEKDSKDVRKSIKDLAMSNKASEYIKKEEEKTLYNQMWELKNFKDKAGTFLTYNQNSLEKMEPENTHTNYFLKYLKLVITIVLGVYIFFKIVVTSFKQLGTERSRWTETVFFQEQFFDLDKFPISEIYPLHFFVTIEAEEMQNQLERLLSDKTSLHYAYQMKIYEQLKC